MKKSKTRVAESSRNIVAIGGGFTPAAVIDYALKLTGKKRPRLLFINTATGDSTESLLRMYSRVAELSCTPSHLTLFARTPPDLEGLVTSQDLIFVGGGNTKSMLAVWREYGLDKILETAWKQGIVLSGSSAGGICWFEGCCTDSYDLEYTALPALGFLSGSCCPHYDGEAGRPAAYKGLIVRGELGDGYAIDEGVGLHFRGEKLEIVVSAKKGSGAYYVKTGKRKGKPQEQKLPVRLLKN